MSALTRMATMAIGAYGVNGDKQTSNSNTSRPPFGERVQDASSLINKSAPEECKPPGIDRLHYHMRMIPLIIHIPNDTEIRFPTYPRIILRTDIISTHTHTYAINRVNKSSS